MPINTPRMLSLASYPPPPQQLSHHSCALAVSQPVLKKMSFQPLAVPPSVKNVVPTGQNARRSADFRPTVWGDRFLECPSDFTTNDIPIQQEYEYLKGKVRIMITRATHKPIQKLNFIDAVQRLGVSYHFESEIEDALKEIYDGCDDTDDLYMVSLKFRLLRQQGYNVSSDAFKKFKDDKGNFKTSLISDVPGMLSLYEATYLSIDADEILDEANVFTTTHLESVSSHLCSPLAKRITHALKWPLRRGVPRLEARHYLSIYQEDDSHNRALLKFAKLDFNLLQAQHQKELSDLTKWWTDLDCRSKLPYARDRLVEAYLWAVGVYFEPQYSLGRKYVVKITATTSLIDDTYDVYGTSEELKLFTEAVERWDISSIDSLPEYMKVIYQTLLDCYSEMEEETAKEGRSFCVHYAKEAMKGLCRAYLAEAKWFHEGYTPTMEEYMRVALVTSTYILFGVNSIVGMGELATREAFEWVFSSFSIEDSIVRASTVICRLVDDWVTHEFEQKRGHVASAVTCYMKQHGVSKEQAGEVLQKQVAKAWKDTNKDLMKPTAMPVPILERVLNLSRLIDFVYKDNVDRYTFPELLKDAVNMLWNDPVV